MEAALIANPTHRRPALVAAIITLVATLVGCDGKGVDVAIIGIPDGATVSVDALPWDTAAAPRGVSLRWCGLCPPPRPRCSAFILRNSTTGRRMLGGSGVSGIFGRG